MGWFTSDDDDNNAKQEQTDRAAIGWLWRKYKEKKQRADEKREAEAKETEEAVRKMLGKDKDA